MSDRPTAPAGSFEELHVGGVLGGDDHTKCVGRFPEPLAIVKGLPETLTITKAVLDDGILVITLGDIEQDDEE
jgi:hypothetical protein